MRHKPAAPGHLQPETVAALCCYCCGRACGGNSAGDAGRSLCGAEHDGRKLVAWAPGTPRSTPACSARPPGVPHQGLGAAHGAGVAERPLCLEVCDRACDDYRAGDWVRHLLV